MSFAASTARGHKYDFFRGRVALYALLDAMGIGPGDEVVLQAFTCLAVVAPVLATGATPVFAEPDMATLGLDPASVERSISSRTRAVVVQHSFGIPADLVPILEIARRHDLYVIEDCAHTLVSTYDGLPVGTFGHAAFYSYEWGKPLVIGLGGAAVVNDPDLEKKLIANSRKWSNPPKWHRFAIDAQYLAFQTIFGTPAYWWARDFHRFLGSVGFPVSSFRTEEFLGQASPDYRHRMDPAHRRRLARGLRSLHMDTVRREHLADRLGAALAARGFSGPVPLARSHPVFVKYPLFIANKAEFLERARKDHVEIYDMFATPIHPMPSDRWQLVRYRAGSAPIAERLAHTVVSIPMHRRMTLRRVGKVVDYLSSHARPLEDN